MASEARWPGGRTWDSVLRGLRFDLNLGSQHEVQDTLTTDLVNTHEVTYLRLTSQSTILVMSGRSHHFLGVNQYSGELMCLAQGHNTLPLVGKIDKLLHATLTCNTNKANQAFACQ